MAGMGRLGRAYYGSGNVERDPVTAIHGTASTRVSGS